jgi:hypothetical protein
MAFADARMDRRDADSAFSRAAVFSSNRLWNDEESAPRSKEGPILLHPGRRR